MVEEAEKRGSFIQGHAQFLNGRMLSAYLCRWAATCHESRTYQEARDGLMVGLSAKLKKPIKLIRGSIEVFVLLVG